MSSNVHCSGISKSSNRRIFSNNPWQVSDSHSQPDGRNILQERPYLPRWIVCFRCFLGWTRQGRDSGHRCYWCIFPQKDYLTHNDTYVKVVIRNPIKDDITDGKKVTDANPIYYAPAVKLAKLKSSGALTDPSSILHSNSRMFWSHRPYSSNCLTEICSIMMTSSPVL